MTKLQYFGTTRQSHIVTEPELSLAIALRKAMSVCAALRFRQWCHPQRFSTGSSAFAFHLMFFHSFLVFFINELNVINYTILCNCNCN